jgi:hypothetical protein
MTGLQRDERTFSTTIYAQVAWQLLLGEQTHDAIIIIHPYARQAKTLA